MSNVVVHQAESGKAAVPNPFFAKVEEALEAVRRRAYELFRKRGGEPGRELDDWLEAERDLFLIPEAEIAENEKSFSVTIAAPGFEAADIQVIALPRELLVEAKKETTDANGCESKCLYRRFEFTSPIECGNVTARLDKEKLVIDAPKKTIYTIPVRAAAA
jgi:HSP20 family molecular chaperone IbpA